LRKVNDSYFLVLQFCPFPIKKVRGSIPEGEQSDHW
jgi:hypothetical protein